MKKTHSKINNGNHLKPTLKKFAKAVLVVLSSYAHADLTTGLVAYYPFNGNANDASGNGNNGTVNGATLTADRFGNVNSAYSFNGSSDYIDIGNKKLFASGDSITITTWVKIPSDWIDSYGNPIIAKWKWPDKAEWGMGTTYGEVGFWEGQALGCPPGDCSYLSSSQSIIPDTWTFVGIRLSGNTVDYVKNGIITDADTNTYAFTDTDIHVNIGGESENGYFFKGMIDELRIYNRALSATEIQQLYQQGTTPDFAIPVMTIAPAAPVTNGTFTATVTVKNQSTVAADGGQLRLFSNQPTAPACAATGGDKNVAVGTLAAGVSKTFTVPGLSAGVGGLKTLRAFVDATCAKVESNETNNQRTLSYRVAGRKADFVVTAMTLTPTTPSANGTFTATVTVKNQGNLSADGGYLDVWANQAAVPTCGAEGNQFVDLGFMAAGTSKVVTINNLIAGNAGTKTARAFVDSWCEFVESNETNNQLTKAYSVQ